MKKGTKKRKHSTRIAQVKIDRIMDLLEMLQLLELLKIHTLPGLSIQKGRPRRKRLAA